MPWNWKLIGLEARMNCRGKEDSFGLDWVWELLSHEGNRWDGKRTNGKVEDGSGWRKQSMQ